MRLMSLVPAALLLLMPATAFAQSPIGQGAISYVSKADYFSIDFPSEPKVQEITYPTEYRITVPGRIYTSDVGRNHYAVTVIDYRNAQKIHEARNEKCIEDAGANKPGLTQQQRRDAIGDACQDDGPEDVRGAITYATWNMIQKAAKVTSLGTYNLDRVEGTEIHTINPDESRTYAVIHMYENRLYLAAATVPKGAPAANWFQVNMRFLDAQYTPVRYEWVGLQIYVNGMPPPPRTNQGQQGGQAPQGQGQPGR
jgi:hypothetical protein